MFTLSVNRKDRKMCSLSLAEVMVLRLLLQRKGVVIWEHRKLVLSFTIKWKDAKGLRGVLIVVSVDPFFVSTL